MDKKMEAVIISNGAYDLASEVEDAATALYYLWERHFSAADAVAIPAHEAAGLGASLRLVHTVLCDALRDFRLSVGEDSAGGAAMVALVREYERITAAERKAGGA